MQRSEEGEILATAHIARAGPLDSDLSIQHAASPSY